ncbi:MAG: hypothetical protein V3V33_08535 [Candidatus Lokiarchaeia archaeon]
MSIIVGRKHGNGYHDSVYCRINVEYSEKFKDLLDYEQRQLKEHSGVIYEREFIASWIKRICIKCPLTYPRKYLEKQGNIFVCPECGLKKIPKGVAYREGKKANG